ncbi:hypothetical protein KDK_40350 [Dictyobacter kobayashii]|uniref:Uncharacterized protein n=1 Tax=Dictyobacter kobayashii TaxID=2014872 RepID=A0A402AMH8_9CHLR|nr:hypothetical protein KDK_40350 [Dictyobacter kobayashii]
MMVQSSHSHLAQRHQPIRAIALIRVEARVLREDNHVPVAITATRTINHRDHVRMVVLATDRVQRVQADQAVPPLAQVLAHHIVGETPEALVQR